jgi:hypothetical protein
LGAANVSLPAPSVREDKSGEFSMMRNVPAFNQPAALGGHLLFVEISTFP